MPLPLFAVRGEKKEATSLDSAGNKLVRKWQQLTSP